MRSGNKYRRLMSGAQPWRQTLAQLRAFLAATDGADNPHSLPAMASPPTITTDSTAGPATTYSKSLTLSTTADVARCLVEGGRIAYAATSFLQPVAATQASGVNVRVASRLSIPVSGASAVAFYVIGTTLPYRFLVDGQYVDATGTVPAVTTGTGNNYIILTFAAPFSGVVTIEMQQGCAVRRVHIPAAASFGTIAPVGKPCKGIVFGDSVTAASAAAAYGDGYVQVAADYLGMELWPSGVGSTGYVNTSSGTRYKLAERLILDLEYFIAEKGQPATVFVAMGLNDIGLSGIRSEADTCFSIIRAKCPAALVFIVTPWDATAPSAPSTDYISAKSEMLAAASNREGFLVLDPQGVAYDKADSVHPTTAGHSTLGLWLNDNVRSAVNL